MCDNLLSKHCKFCTRPELDQSEKHMPLPNESLYLECKGKYVDTLPPKKKKKKKKKKGKSCTYIDKCGLSCIFHVWFSQHNCSSERSFLRLHKKLRT